MNVDNKNIQDLKGATAIQRVLGVLGLIKKHDKLSLEESHILTGLSKSTLIRIYSQLEQQGFVHRYLANQQYCYLSEHRCHDVNCSHLLSMRERYAAKLAKPILKELFEKTGLVSDFSLMLDQLKIVESSFSLTKYRRGNHLVVGHVLDLTKSASGRAYQLGKTSLLGTMGYTQREPHFWGHESTEPIFDLSAIAVPIYSGCDSEVVGSVSLYWFFHEFTIDEAVSLFLDDLKQASKQLGLLIDSNRDQLRLGGFVSSGETKLSQKDKSLNLT